MWRGSHSCRGQQGARARQACGVAAASKAQQEGVALKNARQQANRHRGTHDPGNLGANEEAPACGGVPAMQAQEPASLKWIALLSRRHKLLPEAKYVCRWSCANSRLPQHPPAIGSHWAHQERDKGGPCSSNHAPRQRSRGQRPDGCSERLPGSHVERLRAGGMQANVGISIATMGHRMCYCWTCNFLEVAAQQYAPRRLVAAAKRCRLTAAWASTEAYVFLLGAQLNRPRFCLPDA